MPTANTAPQPDYNIRAPPVHPCTTTPLHHHTSYDFTKSKPHHMLQRLSPTEYWIIILVTIEKCLSFATSLLPSFLLSFFTSLVTAVYALLPSRFPKLSGTQFAAAHKVRASRDIIEICAHFSVHVTEHLVRTKDEYLLTVHRIPPKAKGSPVVYLHHGLLMCSDIWVCHLDRNKNLPFVLHDLGYDVWLGNNRGNKYSTNHIKLKPKEAEFWNFSIDEFALFDIPDTIDYILQFTGQPSLSCVGFSQGSAQTFAALSINHELNDKIDFFIAIAPAMTPKGLTHRIIDSLMKSSPNLMYLFFGTKILLPSAVFWQRIVHPVLFNRVIDLSNRVLFDWKSLNISQPQKLASYSKLYSPTSVKSVVHWFQILRNQNFQMFEENDILVNSLVKPYRVANFPTRTNIKIPIMLIYGGSDSLVDIEVMKRNLPQCKVFDFKVENHEHLDLLWGEDVDELVIKNVIRFMTFFKHNRYLLEQGEKVRDSAAVPQALPVAPSVPLRRSSVVKPIVFDMDISPKTWYEKR